MMKLHFQFKQHGLTQYIHGDGYGGGKLILLIMYLLL